MILLFLAQGFEEIEAVNTIDVLRRAELEVLVVGIGGREITGAHGIAVHADQADTELPIAGALRIKAIVLPGGMPGTKNLEKSGVMQTWLDYAAKEGILIAAICAAPIILGHKGLLQGKRAVCFPGYEDQLTGAVVTDRPVCIDGGIITAKGAGAAILFGLAIVEYFNGKEQADKLFTALQCVH